MIPLVIDTSKVQELRQYAETHPMDRIEVDKILRGQLPVAGDRAKHELNLDFGFRLVFSIEEVPLLHDSDHAWIRHMSVSLNSPGRMPNPIAVRELADLLGFPESAKCQLGEENGVVDLIAPLNEQEITSIIKDQS